jgi:TatD DNase family protein
MLKNKRTNQQEISIFDTHCHLVEYNNKELVVLINKARKIGVRYILNIGYDIKTNEEVIKQSQEFTGLLIALGLHPDCGYDFNEENLI